jgi:hypothetical protein
MLVASVISLSVCVCVRVYVMFAVIGRGCSGINACGKRDFLECVCACLRNVSSHRKRVLRHTCLWQAFVHTNNLCSRGAESSFAQPHGYIVHKRRPLQRPMP